MEDRGSRRLDPQTFLNVRPEKFFTLKGEDTEVITRRGSTFGDISTIQQPRLVRLGVRYDW